jgi:hypothetical protein
LKFFQNLITTGKKHSDKVYDENFTRKKSANFLFILRNVIILHIWRNTTNSLTEILPGTCYDYVTWIFNLLEEYKQAYGNKAPRTVMA